MTIYIYATEFEYMSLNTSLGIPLKQSVAVIPKRQQFQFSTPKRENNKLVSSEGTVQLLAQVHLPTF